jgi:hypothetical protein
MSRTICGVEVTRSSKAAAQCARPSPDRRHAPSHPPKAPVRPQRTKRNRQIPIDSKPRSSPRGFLPWRLPDAGPSARHFSQKAGIRNPCMGQSLSSLSLVHFRISLFGRLATISSSRPSFAVAPRAGTVKDGAAGPSRSDLSLTVTSTAAGCIGRARAFLPCGQTTTIPRGARHQRAQVAPQPCIRLIREDRDHDAVMRIGRRSSGAAGPFFTAAWKPWV